MKTKLLSASDIETILTNVGPNELLDQLIDSLRTGFASFEPQNVQVPTRSGIYYKSPDIGLIEWMPATESDRQLATSKIVGYHPTNPDKRSIPTILSTLSSYDTTSGHLRGILDGTFPTALRTGAMSAIASEILAPRDRPLALGIIGAGAQSVTQIHAITRVLPIEQIIVFDKNESAAKSLESRVSFVSIPVETINEVELPTYLSSLDILCTCTSEEPGSGPLFDDFSNKEDLHINAVGSDFPQKIEIPISLLKRAHVCPDFLEQALVEGECQQLKPSEIAPDVANLLRSSKSDQTKARNTLSVFDSTGHAYADFITTHFFLNYAESFCLGTNIEIETSPTDPLNPYSFLKRPSLPRPVSMKPAAATPAQNHGL